ncbi:nucleotidyltransferase domain-containing protein [Candidatus Parcubacteria bacterium]|nr:nucleotidyltransferase domain-containing protein [Candidatus Parcubacteria bacterium]
MIKEKYLKKIKKKVIQFNQGKDLKFFIFGSSLSKKHFGDLDLGVVGNVNDKELYKLKEDFVDSTLPYFVDVVNFNKVEKEFKKNVFDNKILWIVP